MDRELVLTGLLVITVTGTILGAAPWSPPARTRASARDWERAAWRRLWWPSLPAILSVAILIGWALVEPDPSDEPLPLSALVISAGLLTLWGRVALRAIRALVARPPAPAVTIGLWRPRVRLSPALIDQLDSSALEAAYAHEAAHVRHRDPLRIWVAQAITDLQWPWPSATRRFVVWRRALELARDEEARVAGVEGEDLAAAVLEAARLYTGPSGAAALLESQDGLKERIERLLLPVPAERSSIRAKMAPLAILFALGLFAGLRFGDVWVHTFVGWL